MKFGWRREREPLLLKDRTSSHKGMPCCKLSYHSGCSLVVPQQTRYCDAPLDYPFAQRPSALGAEKDGHGGADTPSAAAASGLELRQLQVTIRHGDRSAIHELPNADEKRWKCQPFSEEIRRKWEDVSRCCTVRRGDILVLGGVAGVRVEGGGSSDFVVRLGEEIGHEWMSSQAFVSRKSCCS